MAVKRKVTVAVNEANGKLPHGWTKVRFDAFAMNIAKRVDPAETEADVYVGLEHLDSESLKINRWGTPADVTGQKLAFLDGDIIFGRRRAYQRKLGVAHTSGICSAHAMVVRPKNGVVESEYLAFFMQSNLFMERAEAISVGSLSPTINWKTIRAESFPLPPTAEQKRIAELLRSVEDVLETFKTAERKAERLRRIVLFRMMNGLESTEPKKESQLGRVPQSWEIKRVGEAGDVQLGRQRAPRYQTGEHTRSYLRVANVFDGYFDLSDVLQMDFDQRDFETYALRKNDILLNEGQSRELVGRCAIYNDEVDDCCFQNTLVRFRAAEDLNPQFAFYYFQFAFYKGVFASIASQTTSIAHLGAERFARLFMAVPSMDEQNRIVEICDSVLAARDEVRNHVDEVLKLKQRLRDSMVYLGFEGAVEQ